MGSQNRVRSAGGHPLSANLAVTNYPGHRLRGGYPSILAFPAKMLSRKGSSHERRFVTSQVNRVNASVRQLIAAVVGAQLIVPALPPFPCLSGMGIHARYGERRKYQYGS
jgi:hypothetical protein